MVQTCNVYQLYNSALASYINYYLFVYRSPFDVRSQDPPSASASGMTEEGEEHRDSAKRQSVISDRCSDIFHLPLWQCTTIVLTPPSRSVLAMYFNKVFVFQTLPTRSVELEEECQ